MVADFLQALQREHRRFTAATGGRGALRSADGLLSYLAWEMLKLGVTVPRWLVGLLLRVVSRFATVRFGVLQHYRIAHLAHNTEIFLRRDAVRPNSGREWTLFFTRAPVNRQLLTMIGRRVRVLENSVLPVVAKACTLDTAWWIDLSCRVNEFHEFNNIPPQLSFTEEEEARGAELLEKMGVRPGDPFVCFHARDRAYLDQTQDLSAEEWRYHDYRDCSIENYLAAAEHLATQGVAAIRMGHVVHAALPSGHHPLVVDYASDFRSDFGDIYLGAKCSFYLGNTAGLGAIAYVFKRPTAAANWIPLGYAPLLESDIYIVKKLWQREAKRFLTFREILERGADEWAESHFYAEAGVETVENSPDEILSLTQEMKERLDGTWQATDEDEELQQRYHALFSEERRCHGFPSRLGAEFLRQNRQLLE